MNIEEKILINEIKKKNSKIFELLFDEYYPKLVKFSESYLHDIHACEDVVQGFFISFWTSAEKLNITTSIRAYIYTSVKNLCINRIRDIKVRDKNQILYLESIVHTETPEDVLGDPGILLLIEDALKSLPPQMAEIFNQKYFHGKQLKEIAKNLNVTEGTVKKQIFRAKTRLKDRLYASTNILFML